MAYSGKNPQRAEFMSRLGHDAKLARSLTGKTCQEVSEMLNEKGNRDRVSKIERGISSINLYDYLVMMWWYRKVAPDHPAVHLANLLLPEDVKRGKLWADPQMASLRMEEVEDEDED